MLIKFEVNSDDKYDIRGAIRMLTALGYEEVTGATDEVFEYTRIPAPAPDLLAGKNGERLTAAVGRALEKNAVASDPEKTVDAPAAKIDFIEASANMQEAIAETPEPTVSLPTITAPPAVSEGEAFAAMQAAVASGVQLPAIVALLNERKVSRVNQLSADDRASFVHEIKQLGGAS